MAKLLFTSFIPTLEKIVVSDVATAPKTAKIIQSKVITSPRKITVYLSSRITEILYYKNVKFSIKEALILEPQS